MLGRVFGALVFGSWESWESLGEGGPWGRVRAERVEDKYCGEVDGHSGQLEFTSLDLFSKQI